MQTFTLESFKSENGCTYLFTPPLLNYVKRKVGTTNQRDGFPRFSVICDGITERFDRIDKLEDYIQSITPGKCVAFLNAGHGVTIDFDRK